MSAVEAPRRSWSLRSVGARPLTTNAVVDMHRMAWAAHTRGVRQEWYWIARSQRVPHLQRARIFVTPLHADNRSPQDPGACSPAAKAAIDGLVDAGILPDDNGTHVAAVVFLPPRVDGADGLELVIEELT